MKILQYYEKKNKYVQSINQIIHLKQNIMETLPIGGSQDFTDSGDDSGGGLAKQNNNFTNYENNSVWDDE